MSNQDDFDKLVMLLDQAETPNEFINTLITGVSTMLTNDIETAKKLFATEQQLQSFADTQVNLDVYVSEFIDVVNTLVAVPSNTSNESIASIAERLAAGEPRSAAHAAVQGTRGAEVMLPVNPAELSDAETMSDIAETPKEKHNE